MNFEVYGEPTQQGVFGSADCVSQAAADAPAPEPKPEGVGISAPVRVFAGVEPAQGVGMPGPPPVEPTTDATA